MTEDEAVEIVHQRLVEVDSIPIQLAMKRGIKADDVAELERAMQFLRDLYKDRDSVPKKLAAAFVDLSAAFENTLSLYSDSEQNRIIDLRDRIVQLALKMLGATPPYPGGQPEGRDSSHH
jgi:hypothetical protein